MKHLVIFDLETTGVDRIGPTDWVVQFSAIKVDRETNKMIGTINEYIRPDGNYVMTIGAYLAHHIHPDFLQDKPTFKELAPKILEFINGCDLLTYNGVQFDIPFLQKEFRRAGIEWHPTDVTCYDSFVTECDRYGLKLEQVFHKYCGRTMEEAGLQPHDGLSDVKALYGIFRHQNDEAPVEPQKIITDDNYINYVDYEGEKVLALTFGKYKNIPLDIVCTCDRSYLVWVLGIGVCEKTQEIINDVLNGQKPTVS